jgi:hypothetical protein
VIGTLSITGSAVFLFQIIHPSKQLERVHIQMLLQSQKLEIQKLGMDMFIDLNLKNY